MATVARTTTRRKRMGASTEGFGVAAEDQSSLDQYLKEVSTHRLLTAKEEVELGAKALAGDEVAVQELVRANLRFVISVAKKYQNRGVNLSDLI
ncbi:MAG: RNA polymerase subunit sigma, partial [Gemmatimonadota bacterium]|nr:RNA polymerase subunit sigma [Gemmatimonadota bacterium]